MPSQIEQQFVIKLTEAQPGLFAFILTLLPDRHAARDVLQETNVTLWEKADEFEPGTSFGAWASRIARFKVLSHFRDQGRDRHTFDEAALDRVANIAERSTEQVQDRLDALAECFKALSPEQQSLVNQRYHQEQSPTAIGEMLGQSSNRIRQSLFRIRLALMKCVEGKTALVQS